VKISVLTDAPKHNLALMKISSWHKRCGDEVTLNMPLLKADYRYASYIFKNGMRFGAQETGGIGINPKIELPGQIQQQRPDYELFKLGHSLGYTFRACPRQCAFCKVPLMRQDRSHHSIWEFHDPHFNRIELLNNNTFGDPFWEETFQEIHEAKLRIIDSSGFDLRLLDDRKASWLRRLKWEDHGPRFAWDRVQDEKEIREGLKLLRKHKLKGCTIYVLMGFDTSFEEDLYRCEIINGYGYDPYPMLFKSTPTLSRFRKFLYGRGYRQYSSIAEAWKDYKIKAKGGNHDSNNITFLNPRETGLRRKG